jgi:hypothetical protein
MIKKGQREALPFFVSSPSILLVRISVGVGVEGDMVPPGDEGAGTRRHTQEGWNAA